MLPRFAPLLRAPRILPLLAAVAVCTILTLPGCDNTFSPKADYTERLVVFAVLDPSQQVQIVRIETTYDAEGTTPDVPIGRRVIDSARVLISDDRQQWVLRDTVMDLGGGVTKKVWFTRALRPQEAKTYRLTVDVPGTPQITSSVFVPSKAYVQIVPPVLTAGKRGVEVRSSVISTVAPPKGYYFRLWVVGRINVNGELKEIRREVPVRYEGSNRTPVYSEPARESVTVFLTDAVVDTKNTLEGRDGATNVQLQATAYTMDAYLYNYFQTVRGFDDPVSVRQDKPDVTNIRGGVGVFGALVADSVRSSYVSVITNN